MELQHQPDAQQQMIAWIQSERGCIQPRRGDILEAVIVDIGTNDVLVDLGTKRDGIVPPRDLSLLDERYLESLAVGDHVPVSVMNLVGENGEVVVSLNKGLERKDWLQAQELMESQAVVDVKVVDTNSGGVLAEFGQLRAFIPNSHLSSIPRGLRGQALSERKQNIIGRTLSSIVLDADQRRRRLVLSERRADHLRSQEVLNELTEGDVRQGAVCNLVDFGAFVDLGGLDGLIHISELDWAHVDHPRDVLSVGNEVEVYVLGVDRERERIALSRRRLLPDPWPRVTQELSQGVVVEGSVTNVTSFGAFVDVGDGVEGLVHISEMPQGANSLVDIERGQPVAVEVLGVDEWRRRISLRLEDIAVSTDESALPIGAPNQERATFASPPGEDGSSADQRTAEDAQVEEYAEDQES